MKLLLDTHIWLWSLLEPGRVRRPIIRHLNDPSNELWLSPLSLWEFFALENKGRVTVGDEPLSWLDRVFQAVPLRDAPLNRHIGLLARSVVLPHSDPIDRLLVATAVALDLTLVTSDATLARSNQCQILANR